MTNQLDSILTTRHATLQGLAELIRGQHSAKRDIVTAASGLSAVGGQLRVAGAGPAVLSETGVSSADLSLRPTSNADADIAAKLDIPIKYLRRLRERHLGLYDTTVTELLRADDRRFLIRASGVEVQIDQCDLSERMYVTVRCEAPQNPGRHPRGPRDPPRRAQPARQRRTRQTGADVGPGRRHRRVLDINHHH
jgi:hypothetical protein